MDTTTISLFAQGDEDDCFAAAVREVERHDPELAGWNMRPRWEDDVERERILLDVPSYTYSVRRPGCTAWVAGVDIGVAILECGVANRHVATGHRVFRETPD